MHTGTIHGLCAVAVCRQDKRGHHHSAATSPAQVHHLSSSILVPVTPSALNSSLVFPYSSRAQPAFSYTHHGPSAMDWSTAHTPATGVCCAWSTRSGMMIWMMSFPKFSNSCWSCPASSRHHHRGSRPVSSLLRRSWSSSASHSLLL